jgi:pimeloyl-ACP methyl ester carboxylesterase
MTLGILQSCCQFGEQRRLAGVITRPEGAVPRAAVVLVSAGLTPKFGPFRLYAQLARRLAGEGLLTLRFDLGGIGDSGQAYPGLPLQERTALEIRSAVDHLSSLHGLDEVILGGLCSGAEDSLRYAETDPRVTGLLLMDPFGYRTFGWRWRARLIRGARRGLWLLGKLPTYGPAGESAAGLVDYRHMERAESSRIMRALLERKVGMHFVYTGGMHESFNHKGQFKRMFRGLDLEGVTLDYFPRLRHTQALELDRRLVVESMARRVPRARR